MPFKNEIKLILCLSLSFLTKKEVIFTFKQTLLTFLPSVIKSGREKFTSHLYNTIL